MAVLIVASMMAALGSLATVVALGSPSVEAKSAMMVRARTGEPDRDESQQPTFRLGGSGERAKTRVER